MKVMVTKTKVEHRTRDLLIGLVACFIAATILLVIFFVNKQIPKNYVEMEGVIDHFEYDYDDSYITFVSYTYNDAAYIVNINYPAN